MSVEFVVQLDNRPGALAAFARSLAARGIDIRSIAGGGLGTLGYAIIATDDPEATRDVLRACGHPFSEGHPVIVEVEDRPGALARIAERLAEAGINIGGLTTVGRGPTTVEVAITTSDVEATRRVLGLEPAAV